MPFFKMYDFNLPNDDCPFSKEILGVGTGGRGVANLNITIILLFFFLACWKISDTSTPPPFQFAFNATDTN